MDKLDSGEPTWELVFDEDGRLVQLDEEAFFIQLESSGVEDMFVFSHCSNERIGLLAISRICSVLSGRTVRRA